MTDVTQFYLSLVTAAKTVELQTQIAAKAAEDVALNEASYRVGAKTFLDVTTARATYEKAQIDPATVGYIECHGTGTSLGDPIEIQALSKAFSELYKRHNKAPAETPNCALSSVKTNIGHLETAAGIAGLLKALLAIKHKQIPANIHFEEINPYITLEGTPFYVADRLTPWKVATGEDGSPLPRRAGVSSFGFSGANAHVVLEEHIPRTRPSRANGQAPQLIIVSAKTDDRLHAYVHSLHAYLEKETVDLVDLAYTLLEQRRVTELDAR